MPRRPSADLEPLDIGAPDDDAARLVALIRAYAARPAPTTADRIARLRGLRHVQHAATQALLATMARAQFLEHGHVPLVDAAEVTGYSVDSVRYQADIGRHLLTGRERQEADATREERQARHMPRRRARGAS